MLVGARGMGVGDERKLHHGGQAQAEDEEQHNDAASLPAGMSLATGERALVFASVPGTRRANLLLVNKKAGEMEHYGVPLPPLEYGPAFTAGERVLMTSYYGVYPSSMILVWMYEWMSRRKPRVKSFSRAREFH